jgi:ribonuclease III
MSLSELQTAIGYHFNNETLLVQSLTHPSYMVQAEDEESSNQRLEFLGDAVLELIISEHLFQRFPQYREGRLTQYRSTLVKSAALVDIAEELSISQYIRVNSLGTQDSPVDLPSSKEDALEALVGAIYLDSDYPSVREVVLNWYGDLAERLRKLNLSHNPKGQLQERLQPVVGNDQIQYKVIKETGPSHSKVFEVELWVGTKPCSHGSGKSKKEAEEQAARSVLEDYEAFQFPNA